LYTDDPFKADLCRVSFCASILCSFAHKEELKITRIIAIGAFSILYLIFVIIFGEKLGTWNLNVPGSCYNTYLLAKSDARHPYVDKIYLGVTTFYMFSILVCSIIFSTDAAESSLSTKETSRNQNYPGRRVTRFIFIFYRFSVLTVALVQYPVHLYSVIAIRSANKPMLVGESENSLGFGQIVALVMLAQTFLECLRRIKGIYSRLFFHGLEADLWLEYRGALREHLEANTNSKGSPAGVKLDNSSTGNKDGTETV
jgi:hypothetical protein